MHYFPNANGGLPDKTPIIIFLNLSCLAGDRENTFFRTRVSATVRFFIS